MATTAGADVKALCTSLMELVRVLEAVPPPPPIGQPASLDAVRRAIDAAADRMPKVYRTNYADPLRQDLPSVFAQLSPDPQATVLETVAGAVYQHGDNPARPAL